MSGQQMSYCIQYTFMFSEWFIIFKYTIIVAAGEFSHD